MENSSVKSPEQLHSLVKVTILKTNYKNKIFISSIILLIFTDGK